MALGGKVIFCIPPLLQVRHDHFGARMFEGISRSVLTTNPWLQTYFEELLGALFCYTLT
jgi:hypothetical protein